MASFIFKGACDMYIGTFPGIKYLLTFVGWDWVGLGAVSSLSLLRVALGRAWCYPAHCSSLRYVLCWMRGLKTAALSFIIYANLISLSSPVWIMTVRKSTGVHLIHLSVSQTQQLSHWVLIQVHGAGLSDYHFPHFTDGKTEAWKRQVAFPNGRVNTWWI